MGAQRVDAFIGLVSPTAAVTSGLGVVAADFASTTWIAGLRAAVAASQYVCHFMMMLCICQEVAYVVMWFRGINRVKLGVGFGRL